jgi:hypothetical protein
MVFSFTPAQFVYLQPSRSHPWKVPGITSESGASATKDVVGLLPPALLPQLLASPLGNENFAFIL